MPRVGEVARIDQNSRAIGLSQDSRMPKVGDPHCTTVGAGCRSFADGVLFAGKLTRADVPRRSVSVTVADASSAGVYFQRTTSHSAAFRRADRPTRSPRLSHQDE